MKGGAEAESRALSFLEGQGLELLERNYRCRMGEIDLIMKAGETLVFVEVRERSNRNFGGAGGSITPYKQDRILRAARYYLGRLEFTPECRFDAVLYDETGKAEWIKGAFTEQDGRAARFR
jgi:putative endonuclease